MANVNVVYGCTGERTMFMGLDLANLKPQGVLGETPVIDKQVDLSTKKYTVRELLYSDVGLKYDLILRMMLDDNVVDHNTTVRVGSNGRLREVYDVKAKQGYRIFGKTYFGAV